MTKIIDLTCSDEEEKPNLNCLKDYVKSKECLLRDAPKHSPLVHLSGFYDSSDLVWTLESSTFEYVKVVIKIAGRRNIGYARRGKAGFDETTAIYLALEQAALEAVVYETSKWNALPQAVPPGPNPIELVKDYKVSLTRMEQTITPATVQVKAHRERNGDVIGLGRCVYLAAIQAAQILIIRDESQDLYDTNALPNAPGWFSALRHGDMELTVPDETMQTYCSGLDNSWLSKNHHQKTDAKKRSFDRIAGFNQARVKFEQSKLAKIDDQSECGSVLNDF